MFLIMEFKGTKGKWEFSENGGVHVTTNSGMICDLITSSQKDKYNALLISKAPEMLFELNETLKDLLVLQGNVLESAKIDKKWDGMFELIQTWIDRKKQLIKEATEL